MMVAQAGHNSAAFDQQLRDDIETVLGDDREVIFHYAQWHIGDYVAGTRGMSLEDEGAYIRFLMRLYERGKPLPDDDRFMATCMALSIRVWRRIKQTLIQFGKIICRNGCLTNARFEKERQRRAEQMRKQAEGARKRWQRERAERAKNAETSPKFAESFDESLPKVSQKVGEKCSKIKGSRVTTHMLTNNQYPLIEEEKNPPVDPPKGGHSQEKPRKRTAALPDGWQPKDQLWEWARSEAIGATDDQIRWQVEKFRNHARANGRTQKDWDAAFRNWIMNAKKFGEFDAGKSRRNGYNGERYRAFYAGVE